jgi:hypothetical protein
MAGKNTAVFGIYQTQADVEYAIDALRGARFPQYRCLRTLSGKQRYKRFCGREKHESSSRCLALVDIACVSTRRNAR